MTDEDGQQASMEARDEFQEQLRKQPDYQKFVQFMEENPDAIDPDSPGFWSEAGGVSWKALEGTMHLMDLPRKVVANAVNLFVGVEPEAKEKFMGLQNVYGSDFVKALGIKDGVEQFIFGMALDFVMDPLSWLFPVKAGAQTAARTAGTKGGKLLGTVGRESLTKAGAAFVKKAHAETLQQFLESMAKHGYVRGGGGWGKVVMDPETGDVVKTLLRNDKQLHDIAMERAYRQAGRALGWDKAFMDEGLLLRMAPWPLSELRGADVKMQLLSGPMWKKVRPFTGFGTVGWGIDQVKGSERARKLWDMIRPKFSTAARTPIEKLMRASHEWAMADARMFVHKDLQELTRRGAEMATELGLPIETARKIFRSRATLPDDFAFVQEALNILDDDLPDYPIEKLFPGFNNRETLRRTANEVQTEIYASRVAQEDALIEAMDSQGPDITPPPAAGSGPNPPQAPPTPPTVAGPQAGGQGVPPRPTPATPVPPAGGVLPAQGGKPPTLPQDASATGPSQPSAEAVAGTPTPAAPVRQAVEATPEPKSMQEMVSASDEDFDAALDEEIGNLAQEGQPRSAPTEQEVESVRKFASENLPDATTRYQQAAPDVEKLFQDTAKTIGVQYDGPVFREGPNGAMLEDVEYRIFRDPASGISVKVRPEDDLVTKIQQARQSVGIATGEGQNATSLGDVYIMVLRHKKQGTYSADTIMATSPEQALERFKGKKYTSHDLVSLHSGPQDRQYPPRTFQKATESIDPKTGALPADVFPRIDGRPAQPAGDIIIREPRTGVTERIPVAEEATGAARPTVASGLPKKDEAAPRLFKHGDSVRWTDKDGPQTGTVRNDQTAPGDPVSVRQDGMSAGGVPIGRVREIRADKLTADVADASPFPDGLRRPLNVAEEAADASPAPSPTASKFYMRTEAEGWKDVPSAKPLSIPEAGKLDLFVHDIEAGWTGISEGRSGALIAKGHTEKEAIERLQLILKSHSMDDVEGRISTAIDRTGVSPRWEGRLVVNSPFKSGDKVFTNHPGIGGIPVRVDGVLYKAKGGDLRVRITGGSAPIGGAKTTDFDGRWKRAKVAEVATGGPDNAVLEPVGEAGGGGGRSRSPIQEASENAPGPREEVREGQPAVGPSDGSSDVAGGRRRDGGDVAAGPAGGEPGPGRRGGSGSPASGPVEPAGAGVAADPREAARRPAGDPGGAVKAPDDTAVADIGNTRRKPAKPEVRKNVDLRGTDPVKLTKTQRLTINQQAREIIGKMKAEGRFEPVPQPTDEEMEVLRLYTGRGGLQEADVGVLNQHYTSYPAIGFIWKKLQAIMGKEMRGASVLEPAEGIGNFFGLMPTNQGLKAVGVEMDEMASDVARVLYPEVEHHTGDFIEFAHPRKFKVVVGNVPFGTMTSLAAKRSPKYHTFNGIHDLFFIKTLDEHTEANGIVAFITSTGTMDKMNPEMRMAINRQAEFLGAYRFPSGTFKANTQYEGATDIIFLRKRTAEEMVPGVFKPQDEFVDVGHMVFKSRSGEEKSARVSQYYLNHPNQVWGKIEPGFGQQFETQIGVRPGKSFAEYAEAAVDDGAIGWNPQVTRALNDTGLPEEGMRLAPEGMGKFHHAIMEVDGKQQIVQKGAKGELIVRSDLKGSSPDRMKRGIAMVESYQAMLDAARAGDVQEAERLRRQTGEMVRDYIAKYPKGAGKAVNPPGYDNTLRLAFAQDQRFYLLAGLADSHGVLSDRMRKPVSEMFKAVKEIPPPDRYNPGSIINYLRETRGMFDEGQAAELWQDGKTAAEDMRTKFLDHPDMAINGDGMLEHAETFYRGDLWEKIDATERMIAEGSPLSEKLAVQADKLRANLPLQVTALTAPWDLRAPWVGPDLVNQWLRSIGSTTNVERSRSLVTDATTWIVHEGDDPANLTIVSKNGGAHPLHKQIEAILNRRNLRILDRDGDRLIDDDEATKALASVEEAFRSWARGKVPDNHSTVRNYNRQFRSWVQYDWTGKEPPIPGMSFDDVKKINPHQWEVVLKLTNQRAGLIAHLVGGGKTFSAIMASQMMKSRGHFRKPLFVVPAKVIENWPKEVRRLFPNAKILNLGKLPAEERFRMLQVAAASEADFIFLSHEGMKEIPLKASVEFIQEDVDRLHAALLQAKADKIDNKTIKQIEDKIAAYGAKLTDLYENMKRTDVIWFEDLGVDAVFVDEAHHHKNVPILGGALSREGLIPTSHSDMAADMQHKAKWISRMAAYGDATIKAPIGRNVFMMTATPTPNHPIEIYSMMQYLAPQELEARGIHDATDFINTYIDVGDADEVGVDGVKYVRKTYKGGKNLHDLRRMVKKYIDFKTFEGTVIHRPDYETIDHKLFGGADLMEIQVGIQQDAEFIKKNPEQALADGLNYLSLHTRGRRAAVAPFMADMKYFDPATGRGMEKMHTVRDELMKHYRPESTQLVFLDQYRVLEMPDLPPNVIEEVDEITGKTKHFIRNDAGELVKYKAPKGKEMFNLHEWFKQELISRGVPENEIFIINQHSNSTSAAKQKIVRLSDEGKARFIIGSTASMGEGMNLQKFTTDVHNIDVPWTPDEMEQRLGRAVRQGNTNEKVRVHRYFTTGSFDGKSYSLLAKKSKFNYDFWLSDADYVPFANIDYADIAEAVAIDDRYLARAKAEGTLRELSVQANQTQDAINRQAQLIATHEKHVAESEQKLKNIKARMAQGEQNDKLPEWLQSREAETKRLQEVVSRDQADAENFRQKLAELRARADETRKQYADFDESIKADPKPRTRVNNRTDSPAGPPPKAETGEADPSNTDAFRRFANVPESERGEAAIKGTRLADPRAAKVQMMADVEALGPKIGLAPDEAKLYQDVLAMLPPSWFKQAAIEFGTTTGSTRGNTGEFMMEKVKGEVRKLVSIYQGRTPSTFFDEVAHWGMFVGMSDEDVAAAKALLMNDLRRKLGKGRPITDQMVRDAFGRGFADYMLTKRIPTDQLRRAFRGQAEALNAVLGRIARKKGNKQLDEIFARMLTTEAVDDSTTLRRLKAMNRADKLIPTYYPPQFEPHAAGWVNPKVDELIEPWRKAGREWSARERMLGLDSPDLLWGLDAIAFFKGKIIETEQALKKADLAPKAKAELLRQLDGFKASLQAHRDKPRVLGYIGNYIDGHDDKLIAFVNKKLRTTHPSQNFRRLVNTTADEANRSFEEAGRDLRMIEDPVVVYGIRGLYHHQVTGSAQMLHEIVRQFGVRKGAIEAAGMVEWVPLRKAFREIVGDYLVPKEVADHLREWEKWMEKPGPILDLYDRALNVWKGWSLWAPAYHVRNLFGNVYNMWLGKGVSVKRMGDAMAMQLAMLRAGKDPSALSRMVAGTGKTMQEWFDILTSHGVLGSGFFGSEYREDIAYALERLAAGDYGPAVSLRHSIDASAAMFKGGAGDRLGAVAQLNDRLLEFNRSVGRMVEDNSKLSFFFTRLDHGDTVQEAIDAVRKYLFDYSDLTQFEQGTMKRLMPFYTWTRKNAALQLYETFAQPWKTAMFAKLQGDWEASLNEDRIPLRLRPDWLRESGGLQLTGGDTPRLMPTKFSWPGADVSLALGVPFEPGEPISQAVNQLSPIIKAPIELATNYNFFQGRPVQEYAGQREPLLGMHVPPAVAYGARMFRPLNDVNQIVNNFNPGYIAGRIGAVGNYQVDRERAARSERFKMAELRGRLKGAMKRAEEKGDTSEVERLQSLMSKVGKF